MSVFPDASFLTSANEPHQFVADTGIEVAFAGRSNAGKSSAINAILNRRNFARTSKTPGRTQLINFFNLAENRRLVDLPGYGYARVSESVRSHWQGLLEEYFQNRRSLGGTIVVVDSRRLLTDFDWQMLEWCRSIECPVHVLLTKSDKLKQKAANDALTTARNDLGGLATVQLFSATKGFGVPEALQQLNVFLSDQTP